MSNGSTGVNLLNNKKLIKFDGAQSLHQIKNDRVINIDLSDQE
jgi:hypothetical protein